MEFNIGKNSTLPILKMQIVKDGRVDYDTFNSLIEKSSIYFSMKDDKTGRIKINLSPAGFINKIFDDPNTPPEYYIYYRFSKKDTNKIGKYEGQFLLKNEEGTLILPIREPLYINIFESSISDIEQETNIITLESYYDQGSIIAEYTLSLKYPVASDLIFSFKNTLGVLYGDPIEIDKTIILPARQLSVKNYVTILDDYFRLNKTSVLSNIEYNLSFSTPFKYSVTTSYNFENVPVSNTPTNTPTLTQTPTPTETEVIIPSPTVTPTLTQTPTPTETEVILIDPILVAQTNEFISVGDGSYLMFMDFEQIITDAIIVNDEYLNVGEGYYLKYINS